MNKPPYEKLLALLVRLDEAKLTYRLAHHREDAIMVIVSVPGECWEIEFLADGSVEIEKFTSAGKIESEAELDVLFKKFRD